MSYIILKVIHALYLGITSLVVNVEVSEQTDTIICLDETATRVCLQSLTDDGVLNRHIVHVAVDTKGLIATPGDRDVIEYHVLSLSNSDAICQVSIRTRTD